MRGRIRGNIIAEFDEIGGNLVAAARHIRLQETARALTPEIHILPASSEPEIDFAAASRFFDLNGETDRARKSQKSEIIAADV
jgi:hypothetical protein